ncbi:hypothetical protein KC357_g17 [Hortaea werneckii]|nr:hypothetical protein KC357_g17 [Hortaea werneckii]
MTVVHRSLPPRPRPFLLPPRGWPLKAGSLNPFSNGLASLRPSEGRADCESCGTFPFGLAASTALPPVGPEPDGEGTLSALAGDAMRCACAFAPTRSFGFLRWSGSIFESLAVVSGTLCPAEPRAARLSGRCSVCGFSVASRLFAGRALVSRSASERAHCGEAVLLSLPFRYGGLPADRSPALPPFAAPRMPPRPLAPPRPPRSLVADRGASRPRMLGVSNMTLGVTNIDCHSFFFFGFAGAASSVFSELSFSVASLRSFSWAVTGVGQDVSSLTPSADAVELGTLGPESLVPLVGP